MEHSKRLRNAALLLFVALGIGVAGYMLIEGWPFHDALYMTVMTLTTVGYREVHPLGLSGQYFTMFLLFFGVGGVFYVLIAAVEFMVEGHLSGILLKRRNLVMSRRLLGHYILCGYGRVGQEISRELTRAGETVLVIEEDVAIAKKCSADGLLCLVGDGTKDESLEEAGVHRAKGLFAALDSDTENVVVTLTAKTLNQNLFVVARAEDEESHRKLKRAGADRTISPYAIGGRRMATMMLRPNITDYLDLISRGARLKLSIEELAVPADSQLLNDGECTVQMLEKSGMSVLALYRGTDEPITNPPDQTIIHANDILLVMGDNDQLASLNKLLESQNLASRGTPNNQP